MVRAIPVPMEGGSPESAVDASPDVASLTGSFQEAMQGMDEDSTQRSPQARSVSAAALAGGGLSSAVGLLSPSPFFNPLAEIQPSAGFQRMTLMCGVCIQKSRDAQSISTQISTFGGFMAASKPIFLTQTLSNCLQNFSRSTRLAHCCIVALLESCLPL